MVHIRHFGGLGNMLGQYCFGRSLAERFGYMMPAAPITGLPQTLRGIKGEMFIAPNLEIGGQWPQDASTCRNLDPGELEIPPASVVTVNGWFQRFELYRDIRDRIQNDWLAVPVAPPPRAAGDFAICLRTRVSDMFEAECTTTEDEVRRLSRILAGGRLFLIADDCEHPLIHALRDLNGEMLVADLFEQFLLVRSFQKVAFCQDALFWWATFLGCAREIYFPKCDRGIWSHAEPAPLGQAPWWHGIDLRVSDEERYIYDW